MANRVVISICGEEYTFVAEEAPSYMQKVGAYVNEKMDEILTSAKVGRTDAAVLTAANILTNCSRHRLPPSSCVHRSRAIWMRPPRHRQRQAICAAKSSV